MMKIFLSMMLLGVPSVSLVHAAAPAVPHVNELKQEETPALIEQHKKLLEDAKKEEEAKLTPGATTVPVPGADGATGQESRYIRTERHIRHALGYECEKDLVPGKEPTEGKELKCKKDGMEITIPVDKIEKERKEGIRDGRLAHSRQTILFEDETTKARELDLKKP
jgi:hypothetical protein